jgi:hypothetical protein
VTPNTTTIIDIIKMKEYRITKDKDAQGDYFEVYSRFLNELTGYGMSMSVSGIKHRKIEDAEAEVVAEHQTQSTYISPRRDVKKATVVNGKLEWTSLF